MLMFRPLLALPHLEIVTLKSDAASQHLSRQSSGGRCEVLVLSKVATAIKLHLSLAESL